MAFAVRHFWAPTLVTDWLVVLADPELEILRRPLAMAGGLLGCGLTRKIAGGMTGSVRMP
jgi:hypothetical protein